MPGVDEVAQVPSWFVVLPDSDAARAQADGLAGYAEQEILHPSGRPWVLGRWDTTTLAVGGSGENKLAVLGQHAVSPGALDAEAAAIRTVSDVSRVARSMVGSVHLFASVGGNVRVQGTVTGVRSVFHARVGNVTIAADQALLLAALLDAGIDEQWLALHLLDPLILYPIAGRPVWRGVDVLHTDHYLVLDRSGRGRQVRWWRPPEPVVPMAEGAVALRDAMSAAVEARVKDRDLVSCDLGGLDSTAVCSLAARHCREVIAYTADAHDPLADDVFWAEKTVAALRNVEHHVIPATEMPLVYNGLAGGHGLIDEPCAAAVDRERWLILARRAASRGSRVHLVGFGGDELLYGSLAHLHSLIRSRPRTAVRYLRGFSAKYRWDSRAVIRQLADRRPYRAWLAGVADSLTAPPPPLEDPLLEWSFQPRVPPWVTPAAVDTVRQLIRHEAPAVEPLSPHRGQHRELETMRFVSRIARALDRMASGLGVTLAAPYYDDRVLEAGLSVRPEVRITPWRYKPLIIEAMRGIVPDESLNRQTKANGTTEEDLGLRQHRPELLALWDDSRLARAGLVDADALREVCSRPIPPQLQIGVLYQTVACEMWLRALEGAPVRT